MNIFEQATRQGFRYPTSAGGITTEDLWKLPLLTRAQHGLCLDNVAKALHRELKNEEEESFVIKPTGANKITQAQFDVVKHVIDVKRAEADAAKTAKANKEKKEKILEILEAKEHDALKDMTPEQLQKMLLDLAA
jgi:hypothetical protein